MKLEFEEFLSSLLPNLVRGTDKRVFLRNKVLPEVKTFATYLYLNGPSYRQVQRLLENLGIKAAPLGGSGTGSKGRENSLKT